MNNILIILTCTVHINSKNIFLFQTNPDQRLACYLKAIKQWLENTSLRICVVENSGYRFPELAEYLTKYQNRFEIISYDERQLTAANNYNSNNSKGYSELYAINFAYNNTNFRSQIDFVIKITGRYFIPDLEDFLTNSFIGLKSKERGYYNSDVRTLALRQKANTRCELLGSHVELFSFIFNTNLYNYDGGFHGHVEAVYNNRIKCLNPKNILTCNEFKIEATQRGGDNGSFNTI